MKFKVSLENVDNEFLRLKKLQEKTIEEQTGNTITSLVQSLKNATPVDTGRARAAWTISRASFDNFNIFNSVPYIQYLNQGSSKQAPARFIEAVALVYGKPKGTIVDVIQD